MAISYGALPILSEAGKRDETEEYRTPQVSPTGCAQRALSQSNSARSRYSSRASVTRSTMVVSPITAAIFTRRCKVAGTSTFNRLVGSVTTPAMASSLASDVRWLF